MVQGGYRRLDEDLFKEAYFESGGNAIRASKLNNFKYSHRTYSIMWKKLNLTIQEDARKKRGSRWIDAFGDLPEAIGRARR